MIVIYPEHSPRDASTITARPKRRRVNTRWLDVDTLPHPSPSPEALAILMERLAWTDRYFGISEMTEEQREYLHQRWGRWGRER